LIFKGSASLYVRIANKYVQRATGLKGFYFDANGEYATENETMCKVLKQSFEVKEENNVMDDKPVEKTEEEIRALAKEKGIKSWHIKSIDKLMAELKEE